jgi:uncharacterized protein DUF4352
VWPRPVGSGSTGEDTTPSSSQSGDQEQAEDVAPAEESESAPEAQAESGSAESENVPEPAQEAKNEEQKSTAYGLNEAVTVGDASWVITNAQKTNQLADPFGVRPAKQGTFIIVDFQFRNGDNEPKTLHQGALQLVDGSGRESDPDTDTLLYIPEDKNIFLEQVNPGVTETGQVVFTVAPDASSLKLVLKDTNLFKSARNQAEVNLGF